MSMVKDLSSAETVAEALYNIVCPMLASENCIKCISDNGDSLFTTDVLCLLSHLDIEHPVCEVILQALEAHRENNGTGSKTLLFMITHISKVVSQLHDLGIPIKKSMGVINEYISLLIQGVENIAIPVSTETEITSEGISCLNEALYTSTDKSYAGSKDSTNLINASSVHKGMENNDISTMNMLHNRKTCGCFSNDILVDESVKSNMEGPIDGINGDSTSDLLETDPVLLKMEPAKQSVTEGDILWYFSDSNSNNESDHKPCHSSQTSLSYLSKVTKLDEHQPLKQENVDVSLSFCESLESSQSFTFNPSFLEECKGGQAFKVQNSFKNNNVEDKQEHDSDFEDCFDDEENRKHFSFTVETTPHIQNQHISKELMLLHNASKHFPSGTDFDFSMQTDAANGDESEDEFSACFAGLNLKHINNQTKGNTSSSLRKYESCLNRNIDSNVVLCHADNNTYVVKEPVCAPVQVNNCRSSIAKLNDMLDSVSKLKALNLSSNSGSATIVKQEGASTANPLHNSPFLDVANSNEKLEFLEKKPKDLQARRSHRIRVSSRHLQELEVKQPISNIMDYKSKSSLLPNQNDFENLGGCDSLGRDTVNFEETMTEVLEDSPVKLKDHFSFNKVNENTHKVPVIKSSLCHVQKLILPEDTRLLVDADLTDAVKQLLQHQINDREFTRFNLKLVNCLHALDFTPSQTLTDDKCVFVLPGMILPCYSHMLQKLSQPMDRSFKRALLIKGDLTHLHHHKGYKSTLKNKVIITTTTNKDPDPESAWTSSVLTTVQRLKIDILLVKGNVKEKLMDILDSAGVLVFTNLSFNALHAMAFIKNIDMVTYIFDASEEHVCEVQLQPLSENWMDHLDVADTTRKHYVKVLHSSEVQTVVLRNLTQKSACIVEEKLWKSLNCLSNAIKDKKVLPGGGKTEAWCAELLKQKSISCLEANQGIQHTILELLSEVFLNYSYLVKQNRDQQKTVSSLSLRRSQKGTKIVSSGNLAPRQNLLNPTFPENLTFVSGIGHAMEDRNKELKRISPLHNEKWKNYQNCSDDDLIQNFHLLFSKDKETVYDNFSSKLASWEVAVDVVQLLSNLDSLLITGIDMTSSDREFAVF